MDYILGVDSGGTKTVAQIANIDGEKISEGKSGSGNYKSVGIERAKLNITGAVLDATNNLNISENFIFKSSCFGLSGRDIDEDENIYRKIIFNSRLINYLNSSKVIICNDTKIGLAAGTDDKNGVIIICGTGSNCYGMNEKGVEAKAGGWDYILGDEGSGYEIGLKALRAIIKEYDGRGEPTLLSKTILEYINVSSVLDLMRWVYGRPFSKMKISSLAEIVCKTARMNDNLSVKILEGSVNEALISIMAVTNKLDLEDKNFTLVLVGSVFNCEKYFKNKLVMKLRKKFSKINFVTLNKKPVEGAIKLALKNLVP